LAKKNEEIFLPGKNTSIVLPRNSQSLYLVQRIRDEAHRFAHEFNRSSHAKTIVKSQLDQIAGVGNIMKRKLLKTFGSLDGIRNAPMDDLIKCCGQYLAKKIKESL
jgi:excinuclease ABC subunit C